MQTRTRSAALLVGAAIALTATLGAATAAYADTEPVVALSAEDLAYFHSVAERFGVPDDVEEALLAKVEAGIPLDSTTGAEPVSVVTSEINGFARTVETFADGSIIGTDTEIPRPAPEGVTPFGVSGCVYGTSAGVHYGQDCWVYTSGLTAGASFYTSFSVWSGGASVSSWHTPAINIVGGSLVDSQFLQPDGKTIQLRFRYSTGGVVSTTNWIQAAVVGTGLSQTRGGTW